MCVSNINAMCVILMVIYCIYSIIIVCVYCVYLLCVCVLLLFVLHLKRCISLRCAAFARLPLRLRMRAFAYARAQRYLTRHRFTAFARCRAFLVKFYVLRFNIVRIHRTLLLRLCALLARTRAALLRFRAQHAPACHSDCLPMDGLPHYASPRRAASFVALPVTPLTTAYTWVVTATAGTLPAVVRAVFSPTPSRALFALRAAPAVLPDIHGSLRLPTTLAWFTSCLPVCVASPAGSRVCVCVLVHCYFSGLRPHLGAGCATPYTATTHTRWIAFHPPGSAVGRCTRFLYAYLTTFRFVFTHKRHAAHCIATLPLPHIIYLPATQPYVFIPAHTFLVVVWVLLIGCIIFLHLLLHIYTHIHTHTRTSPHPILWTMPMPPIPHPVPLGLIDCYIHFGLSHILLMGSPVTPVMLNCLRKHSVLLPLMYTPHAHCTAPTPHRCTSQF